MEVWTLIQELAMGILSTVGVIVAIILRSAKPKSPAKQARWEEETAHKRIEQKRNRLAKLRKEDDEYQDRILKNLKEEALLEKELGENGKNA